MKDELNQPEDLRIRTKRFALAIIKEYVALPKNDVMRVLGGQFLRSGTSPGAHYHEACRARSDAEFISKLEVALQELDETIYWLDLVIDSGLHAAPTGITALIPEANELISIFTTIVRKRKAAR